jgi:hypothetical protein
MSSWRQKVSTTFLAVENRKREEAGLPTFPRHTTVLISSRQDTSFRLLNLKVWCLRYHVSLSFILDVLLDHFAYVRKRWSSQDPSLLSLSVPLASFTGAAARQAIEEALVRAFPGEENYLQANHELRQQIVGHRPLLRLSFGSTEDMLERYSKIMKRRQRQILTKRSRRPWRGNPWK